jgi:tetratricopeptide (TPR) repeat protein
VFRLWGLHPGRDFDLHATAALADTGADEARRLTHTLYVRLLSGILWHYLETAGYHGDALVLHAQASTLATKSGDRAGEADTLTLIGFGYWRMGRSSEALRYLEEALAIVRDTGNQSRESYVLTTLGLVCRGLGRYGDALNCLEQALPITRDTDDRTSQGYVLTNLGDVHLALGRHDVAIRCLEDALEHFRHRHPHEPGLRLGYRG